MAKKPRDEEPETRCDLSQCFANHGGHCIALTSTDFHGRQCPFYKTADQLDEERHRSRERLRRLGLAK